MSKLFKLFTKLSYKGASQDSKFAFLVKKLSHAFLHLQITILHPVCSIHNQELKWDLNAIPNSVLNSIPYARYYSGGPVYCKVTIQLQMQCIVQLL